MGRRVSILNDDPNDEKEYQEADKSTEGHTASQAFPSVLVQRPAPPPNAQLVVQPLPQQVGRSPSQSPLHHFFDYRFPGPNPTPQQTLPRFEDYVMVDGTTYADGPRRPSLLSNAGSSSYEDDGSTAGGKSKSSAKRFPCRYRDTHACQKTFTTSGHASRHSKIHTAEKAVPCTHPGCPKKFTRADNMKQHLETHNKDKSRQSSRSSPSSGKSSSSSNKIQVDSAAQTPPLPSPADGWDASEYELNMFRRRSSASLNGSSGLDTLAMAVAYQKDH